MKAFITDEDIIYEDNHLIAVCKPAGMLVQGDETGDAPLSDLVKDYLKKKYNKPGDVFLGVIHRIDRPVSGLVLMAKTSKALTRMNLQFAEKHIRKTYLALVRNRPPELSAILIHYLTKDTSKNLAIAHNKEVKGSKKAELEYHYLGVGNHYFLLKVNPVTGRPHQIRVQLSKMGFPIAGDLKYGSDVKAKGNRIYLHAARLDFEHPVKKEKITLRCPLPNEGNWTFFKTFDF